METSTRLDEEACYRAVHARDPRFDGWFVTAVRTTGIYCRPSCPATTPKRANVAFFPTAAAAQRGGYRACRRCRPDASPGSPAWAGRGDIVARAMRLIADGVVDRDGVGGLARRLGYSERQLHRLLLSEVGAGAVALARAQRAQAARVLIETTDLPFTEVAFAAGFASVRQFNDTVRDVFAATPTGLRGHDGRGGDVAGSILLRLPHRSPMDHRSLFAHLAATAVPGVESWDGTTLRRTLSLPRGPAVVALTPAEGHVACRLQVTDWRDVPVAVARCRRLLDLDADPEAVDARLRSDPLLGPLVAANPGRRVPAAIDGAEAVVRAVLGQQISTAGARTLAARVAAAVGQPLPEELDPEGCGLHRLFPTAAEVTAADPALLPMPRARARALTAICGKLAAGDLQVDPGCAPDELRARLEAEPGIGPWTAAYAAIGAVGHPDVFLASDVGVRRGLDRLGAPSDPVSAAGLARRWRPWRSYALHHIWSAATETTVTVAPAPA